jgi:hypothetical protein
MKKPALSDPLGIRILKGNLALLEDGRPKSVRWQAFVAAVKLETLNENLERNRSRPSSPTAGIALLPRSPDR